MASKLLMINLWQVLTNFYPMKNLVFFFTVLFSLSLSAQEIYIKPYLQNATPTSMVIMWEMDAYAESFVEWGIDSSFTSTNLTSYETTSWPAHLFSSKLDSLEAGQHYYYRVVSGFYASSFYDFYTPELQSAEESINFIAMSDMQQSSSNPTVFNNLIEGSVLPYIAAKYEGPINENLDLFLVPGDLVNNGYNYAEYHDHFFDPAEDLLSKVPVYPVPGNHELDAAYFFQYFDLPKDGTAGYKEHWWSRDESNIKIIGLDSNTGYRIETQLNWLDSVLVSACSDSQIDFVFAELHHPHKSELWIAGNTDYTGEVIELLENFSTDCGKPSIHFYGHTHGYSRGQSKEHEHLMVNVASGGGYLDYWGEYAQSDYEEFSISQDEYGFVFVEVQAGDDPKFTLKRLSIGDDTNIKNTTLEDSITIRLNNLAPSTPSALFPLEGDSINPDCLVLKLSDYTDPDNNEHGATQWQISNLCSDFSEPLIDRWLQHENWYFDINTQEGDNLCDESVNTLNSNDSYCWRARYRDQSLAWSDWSNPVSFYSGSSQVTQNLLHNSGAESGVEFWEVQSGALESLFDGECAGTSPFEGSKYFGIGGLCEDNEFGSASQTIDISSFSSVVETGSVYANYGAMMSNYNGYDIPSFALQFLDDQEEIISSTDTISSFLSYWDYFEASENLPTNTRFIKYILMGERFSGDDNDSYVDNTFLRLNLVGDSCNPYSSPDLITIGCTNVLAFNYDSLATADDGSCIIPLVCSNGFSMVSLELQTDPYPEETSWDLQDENGNVIYQVSTFEEASTLYLDSVCVANDQTISFNLYDSYGDGLTSSIGSGYFNFYVCGELLLSGVGYGEVITETFTGCGMQSIELYDGWNMVSSYMMANEMDIEVVCAEIVEDIVVMKNYLGNAYLPDWGFNGIGDWDLTQGYQIKVSQDVALQMAGSSVAPELTSITVNEGWNLISYLRFEEASTEAVFESIVDAVTIVKNSLGEAYLPSWGFEGIGNMKAGQGYHVKMNSSEELLYNANDISYRMSFTELVDNKTSFKDFSKNTGSNMHLLIPQSAWAMDLNYQDEVYVYDVQDQLVGAARITFPNTLITIWGDDETTITKDGLANGDAYYLSMYSSLTNTKQALTIQVEKQMHHFVLNEVLVANQVFFKQEELELVLFDAVPNPSTHTTEIRFFNPQEQNLSLKLYNVIGEEVLDLENGLMPSGYHVLQLNVAVLPAGSYFYKLKSEYVRTTKRLEVIK